MSFDLELTGRRALVTAGTRALERAFSETDVTDDLKRFDEPTLIVHGDDDQIVPIGPSAHAAARLIPHATLMASRAKRWRVEWLDVRDGIRNWLVTAA